MLKSEKRLYRRVVHRIKTSHNHNSLNIQWNAKLTIQELYQDLRILLLLMQNHRFFPTRKSKTIANNTTISPSSSKSSRLLLRPLLYNNNDPYLFMPLSIIISKILARINRLGSLTIDLDKFSFGDGAIDALLNGIKRIRLAQSVHIILSNTFFQGGDRTSHKTINKASLRNCLTKKGLESFNLDLSHKKRSLQKALYLKQAVELFESFENLPHIKDLTLNLRHNQIWKSLNTFSQIITHKNLKTLHLNILHNPCVNDSSKQFSQALSTLTNLKTLIIKSDTNFIEVSKDQILSNITHLHIKGAYPYENFYNLLYAIPQKHNIKVIKFKSISNPSPNVDALLSSMISLTILHLNLYDICDTDCLYIAAAIKNLITLKDLSLGFSKKDIDDGIISLCDTITYLPNLTVLKLTFRSDQMLQTTCITRKGFVSILTLLGRLKDQLTSFGLQINHGNAKFNNETLMGLADKICIVTRLKKLKLGFIGKHDFTDIGFVYLFRTITKLDSLNILGLKFEGGEIAFLDDAFIETGYLLMKASSIQDLKLKLKYGRNFVTDIGFIQFLASCQKAQNLRNMNLKINGDHLTNKSINALLKFLGKSLKLRKFTIKFFHELTKPLDLSHLNSYLTYLKLHGCLEQAIQLILANLCQLASRQNKIKPCFCIQLYVCKTHV